MSDASLPFRRLLALRLPRLATDRLHRRAGRGSSPSSGRLAGGGATDAPLAIFGRVGAAQRLEAVDAWAEAEGLAAGQPLAEARARVPGARFVERDPAGETASLEAIADWCDRWTPLVALDRTFDGEAGLLLDVTGVAHLFGGEGALAEAVVASLGRHGFAAAAAIAGSGAAARAVVRHGLDGASARVIAPGEDVTAVAPLPAAAIDPDGERVGRLMRLGLDTVGALGDLPRAAVARRFGGDLLDRLDEACGRLERPISPRRPVAALTAERGFAEPILSEGDVAQVVHSLAEALGESLERRGEGLRQAELALWRVDGTVQRVRIGTGRAIRDPDLVVSLFAERLKGMGEAIEVGFGIDLVRLSLPLTGRFEAVQGDFSGADRSLPAFEELVDRLGARLGARRITRALPGDGHLPEAAVALVPAASAEGRAATAWGFGAAGEPPVRPVRLFVRPEPIETLAEMPDGPPRRFRWRRVLYEVDRAEGPERIAVPWWRLPFGLGPEADGSEEDASHADATFAPGGDLGFGAVERRLAPEVATRDYFRVEEVGGRRFWIFRAGIVGRETARPRWFLHGLFA